MMPILWWIPIYLLKEASWEKDLSTTPPPRTNLEFYSYFRAEIGWQRTSLLCLNEDNGAFCEVVLQCGFHRLVWVIWT